MLRPIQHIFLPKDYPDLIAGLEHPDDAAVWKLEDDRALVMTTDFFTPIVDDPYDYGLIAAANSLSDIYAMGGEPFLALNICAIPPQLPTSVASEILRGGADMAKRAGVVIAGGHTIQDKEPKYGLVVIGFVHPGNMMTKSGLLAGDVLFLSKPIGSGVVTSAIKADKISATEARETIEWLKRLNKPAAQLAVRHKVRSATDITGFSLLGHAWEMAEASGVGMIIENKRVPLYPHTEALAAQWTFPGGGFDNAEFFGPHVTFPEGISKETQLTLFDPQTSGGLLFAAAADRAEALEMDAKEKQIPLWRIGRVTDGEKIVII